jgi:hypothetical protein
LQKLHKIQKLHKHEPRGSDSDVSQPRGLSGGMLISIGRTTRLGSAAAAWAAINAVLAAVGYSFRLLLNGLRRLLRAIL